jgi:ElaA protein
MDIEWTLYQFDNLSLTTLYEIMVLRQEVFVVEQQCPYLDADGYDHRALHLCGRRGGKIVAYSRIFPPGVKYTEASIGRVLTAPSVRGQLIGKELMKQAIAAVDNHFPHHSITISAQAYLDVFYRELGFQPVGELYDEDGIPHQRMIYEA